MNNLQRIQLAQKALNGVAIGDAFGDSFFGDADSIAQNIYERNIPQTLWEFTDDTVMSLAVLEELESNGTIDQNSLMQRFCINHNLDPMRGYGATVRMLLREASEGKNWQEVAASLFEGQGSMGNGAAMRVCPIGAYYFDDFNKVKELATLSAMVTHTNVEAVAGAIAVAIATAITTKFEVTGNNLKPLDFIDEVVKWVPDTDTKSRILKSKAVPYNYHIETVRTILGNGTNMIAQDTVPFAIWCAAYNQSSFDEALWKAVSVLGDRDTICAIVGGITVMSTEESLIPNAWRKAVEDFNTSVFRTHKALL